MPITKKKGAIFAIYADSPEHPSSSSSFTTSLRAAPPSPTAAKRSSTSTTTSSSSAPRKALSSLQPEPLSATQPPREVFKGKALDVNENLKPSKGTTTLGDALKKPVPFLGPNKRQQQQHQLYSTSPVKPRRAAPAPLINVLGSKRNRELVSPLPIYTDAPPSSTTSAKPSATAGPSSSSVHAHAHGQNKSKTKSGPSPAKRNRTHSTPVKPRPADLEDKENVAPTMEMEMEGSPATRTRSKTRATSISTTSLTTLTDSPLVSTLTTTRHSRVDSLIGDGRGTLTLKKGRTLAAIMNAGTEEEARAAASLIDDEVIGVGKVSRGKKGLSVKADGPLADVSEAYGASGDEPAGFKTQRR